MAVCPKQCIHQHKNEDDSGYMEIDENECINCGKCRRVCPNLDIPEMNMPSKCFAAWSINQAEHTTSASGGIAASLYKYAVKKGMSFTGVALDENYEARYYLSNDAYDVERFKNSKYTYSNPYEVFIPIKEKLQQGENVLFIGLPCHVAAIKNYINTITHRGELFTVDLVCHGTPPPEYLQQHVKHIEISKGKDAKCLFFRDPRYHTDKYAFTIYDESIFAADKFAQKNLPISREMNNNNVKPFYKKYVDQGDLYQVGYHNALIYRECCYQCHYAKGERVSDITIGDYHGLGQASAYLHERKEVSCVLINTVVGMKMWEELCNTGMIVFHERPVEEPLKGERQLQAPSVAPPERGIFLHEYKKTKDFEQSAQISFARILKRDRLRRMLPLRKLISAVKRVVPRSLKEKVKETKRKKKRKV